MHIRKKLNKSGVISVQVIGKIKGKSKLIKTIGSSKEPFEVDQLVLMENRKSFQNLKT
jgi:hypothetical protein